MLIIAGLVLAIIAGSEGVNELSCFTCDGGDCGCTEENLEITDCAAHARQFAPKKLVSGITAYCIQYNFNGADFKSCGYADDYCDHLRKVSTITDCAVCGTDLCNVKRPVSYKENWNDSNDIEFAEEEH